MYPKLEEVEVFGKVEMMECFGLTAPLLKNYKEN
jgi:hypothetical protein